MSQKNLTSKVKFSNTKSGARKGPSSKTPRIESAILYGKATPIQSYRSVKLVRFEHEHGKDGPMVVIAEELPLTRHKFDIPPGQSNISEQAGKHFKVVCAYNTSSDCMDEDFTK